MMLARQKSMLAMVMVCSGIILVATLAYVIAAERIGREHLAPDLSRTMGHIIEAQMAASPGKLQAVQTTLYHMAQHYQIQEAALYNQRGERLAHSHSGEGATLLAPNLHAQPLPDDYFEYRFAILGDEFDLLVRNDVSLPGFFYMDTLSTSLVIVTLSAMLVFMLYLMTRQWQQTPYMHLLEDIREANTRDDDGRITLKLRDPDLHPLIEALNDLFWRRNQRTQHLKTAHQQAEHARLRATRLSTETRQMNENLAKEVSVRRSVEVQLKNTQTLLDGILNAMPTALFALDSRNRIVQCNEQAGDWLNMEYSQLNGLPLAQLIPELGKLNLMPSTPGETPHMVKSERVKIRFDDKVLVTDVLAYPLPSGQQARLVIRIDDVSQRQRMEEVMVQTEKMMTVGGLAAGMAHEINNPLGAILQNLQNTRRRLDPNLAANKRLADELGLSMDLLNEYLTGRGIDQFFDHIQSAGERAARIVANMLQFSRNDHLQKRDIGITELINTTLNIAHNDLSLKHIDLDIDKAAGDAQIHCVPSEIEQVLLNLLRNAQQALEEHDGGEGWHPKVRIRASRQNNMTCLEIEDNGPGIPADIAPHIFEPFYTTKEVGDGTGLGLSVSYFIVTSHHQGRLRYQRSALGGACFVLCLPAEKNR